MRALGEVVAAAVRAERARQNLRQEDLAALLGWNRSSVGHLETGRREVRVSDLPALCDALHVSLLDLLRHAHPADLRKLGLRR